jgi:hypothetical protein
VTSFEPLRIYVYKEGLARFASEPYSPPNADKNGKINKFAHLTNYSINKKNEKFVKNNVFTAFNLRMLKKMILEINGVLQLSANILKQLE